MKLKLALGVILGVTCTSAVAEARAQWHLYGTVPVTGDHLLENAYRSALDRCSLTSYPSYDRPVSIEAPMALQMCAVACTVWVSYWKTVSLSHTP